MATDTLSIPLSDERFKGSDYVANPNDTQYVTLTDGGDLNSVKFAGWGKDTPTESGEGPGGDDEFHIDLSGFNDDFLASVASMDSGDTFYVTKALSWNNVGNVYTIDYLGSDGVPQTMSIDVESTNHTGTAHIEITCFAKGMKIETADGLMDVQALSIGDQVLCGDGQYRPIRWTSARHINDAELAQHPEYRPVRIRKGALGDNKPNADLIVSPQHRILIDDWRAELMFGQPKVLVAAIHMIDDNTIIRDYSTSRVSYYHFMFEDHQTVWSNGLQSESFYPGATAIAGIDSAARHELLSLFPDLAASPEHFGQTRHPALKAHEALALFGG